MKHVEKNKPKSKEKEHGVETPPPPQVMDPSASPEKQDSDKENSPEKGKSAKKTNKPNDRNLSSDEEL